LVTTLAEFQQKSDAIVTAQRRNLFIVSEDFIVDCIAAKKRIVEDQYILKISAKASDAKVRYYLSLEYIGQYQTISARN
jgi:hypothetical protein